MKCPSCGAETQGKFCEYCGSEMPKDNSTINITNNYYGSTVPESNANDDAVGKCPKCGHSKITFKRERLGTATQSTSRKNVIGSGRKGQSVSQTAYRTVGVCQNCGYTWSPNTNASSSKSGKKTWLWVLGWICIFPLPLTILLLRKKDMRPAIKYGIIAIAWVVFLAIGMSGNGETNTTSPDVPTNNDSIVETESTDNSSTVNNGENSSDNETDAPEETETLDVVLGNYISNVVAEYNSQATEQLVFVEDFTPSDKESGHYRTEFRLNAYKDAVGKSYLLGDKVVDIVASQTIFGETDCRVYTNDTSIDQVVALVQGMFPILDSTMTDTDLQETINKVSTEKYANGYYYGKLGLLLLGNDTKGYELMIKTD